MNTPLPPPPPVPTPQMAPTAAGVLQGLATGILTVKAAKALGLGTDAATVLAGAVVSAVTSLFHRVAQRLHWT